MNLVIIFRDLSSQETFLTIFDDIAYNFEIQCLVNMLPRLEFQWGQNIVQIILE